MKKDNKIPVVFFTCIIIISCLIDNSAGEENASTTVVVDDDNSTVDHWQLYILYGDPTVPLYPNNSAKELLSICGGLSDCEEIPKSLSQKKINGICARENCLQPCNRKRLYNLCVAQLQVSNYQKAILKKVRWIILLVFQVLTCCAGLFLLGTGHFKFQNVPVVGNELLDKPTGGVNYSHYMWMRWVILGNTNFHWKTHLKATDFIFEWIPLAETEWDPPVIAQEDLEPRDSDHPFWNIELLKHEHETKGSDPKAELADYWNRIYTWSWVRYRGKGTKLQLEQDYADGNVPPGVKPDFITCYRSMKKPHKKKFDFD